MDEFDRLRKTTTQNDREIRRLRVQMDQIAAGGSVRATSIDGVIPATNRPVAWWFNANLLGLGDELELLEGAGVWISGSFVDGRAYYHIGAYCVPPCGGGDGGLSGIDFLVNDDWFCFGCALNLLEAVGIWISGTCVGDLASYQIGTYNVPDEDIDTTGMKLPFDLGARSGLPTTTGGCEAPVVIEAITNDIDRTVMHFATGEKGFWELPLPGNYDGGTVTYRVHWMPSVGASAGDTVIFGLRARAYADSDAIDQAYGAQITVTDTVLAVGDVHISTVSAPLTIGGGPAADEYCIWQLQRTGGTMSEEAQLLKIVIEYGINALSA